MNLKKAWGWGGDRQPERSRERYRQKERKGRSHQETENNREIDNEKSNKTEIERQTGKLYINIFRKKTLRVIM